MRKRGLGHVEMILSFVIFISVVVFALFFFNPGQGDRLIDSSLGYTFDEVYNNISTEFERYSISFTNEASGTQIVAVEIQNMPAGSNSLAIDKDGNSILTSQAGNIIYVDRGVQMADFVSILLSNDFEFPGNLGSTPEVNYTFYEIGSVDSGEILFEKGAIDLEKSYNENYTALREEFNLPARTNFGFELIFSEEDKVGDLGEVPLGLEAFARAERVEVVRENGGISFADVLVRIW